MRHLGKSSAGFIGMACAVALATLPSACGGKSSEGGPGTGSSEPAAQEPAFAKTPAAVPQDQPGTEDGLRPHLNLQNLVHLADVDQGGLFLDFGTPARAKYTAGEFKTGWLADGAEGDTTFTYVGASGRVYLPIEGSTPRALRIRLKALGTKNLQLFVNNEMLPAVRIASQSEFTEHEIELPANVLKAGENQVLLRFGGTTKLHGEDVAAAIDYVRVVEAAPAAAAGTPAPAAAPATLLPRYAALVRDVTVGGARRKAVALTAPSTLSYYVEVPEKASLSLRVGQSSGQGAHVKVRVTPAEGAAEEVFTRALEGAWADQVVSLAKWSGQVVRLDFAAEGQGEVAWSSPTMLVPKVEVKKPDAAKNVIVLLVDTLPAKKLRVYNPKSRVETPALDAFAREGVVFERAQSPENWTKPSVASVLTGLYPMTHRTKEDASKLPDSALMVSEVFKKAGFGTATFIANGYVSDKFGFAQGWDYYTNYIRENKSTKAENVFKDAGDWIEKHKDQRFFAYVQTIDPHVPYDPPDSDLAHYDPEPYTGAVSPRKTPEQLAQAKRSPPAIHFNERDRQRLNALYDGEVTYHDREFAKFVERLRGMGVYDDTAFIVTADHGEEFHEHGSWGHGHSLYQELLHVPFIVRKPGAIPAGKRVGETVGTVDISPTALALAGVEVPDVMEGIDRVPHALGDAPALPAVAFSDFLDDRRTIRAGRYKLVLRGINATLFDLDKDPNEQQELAIDRHPIAMRYCRMLIGQFLGAKDRRNWLSAEQGAAAVELKQEAADIDEATRAGLKALGYAN